MAEVFYIELRSQDKRGKFDRSITTDNFKTTWCEIAKIKIVIVLLHCELHRKVEPLLFDVLGKVDLKSLRVNIYFKRNNKGIFIRK